MLGTILVIDAISVYKSDIHPGPLGASQEDNTDPTLSIINHELYIVSAETVSVGLALMQSLKLRL